MTTADSKIIPARRWRSWWLAVPLVPLAAFAAVLGYDQLQAQQQEKGIGFSPSPPRNPNPQNRFVQNPAANQFQPPVSDAAQLRPNQSSPPSFGEFSPFGPPPSSVPSQPVRPQPSGLQPGFHGGSVADPTQALANELRQLDPQNNNYESKRVELETKVAAEFDARHQQQLEQLAEAEEKLIQLKRSWERRAAAKDQIVARRINELLGEPDLLRWDAAPTMGRPNALTRVGPPRALASSPPVASGSPADNSLLRPVQVTVMRDGKMTTETRYGRESNSPPPTLQPQSDSDSAPPPGNVPPATAYAPSTLSPNSNPAVGVPISPNSRTFRRVDSSPPAGFRPTPTDANRVASELVQRIQEIKSKEIELKRIQELHATKTVPATEQIRVASELAAARQQQVLLTLQLEQLEKQIELQHEHAKQALENAEKRLQVAREPLDASDPASHRQQQRDIAEAETMLMQAQQQLALAELQVEYLQRLRDSVGKVNQQELGQPAEAEDSPDAEEAGEAADAAEAVAY